MSFVDPEHIQRMSEMLGERRGLAYALLFAGSFCETLFPLSILVPGELFFLSGALLAGMGMLDIWFVLGVLYAGALLGDNASYWLGRRYGLSLFDRMATWPLIGPLFGRLLHRKNYRRAEAYFKLRGGVAVLIARLSGPLSWVMPAMAGAFRLKYSTFLSYNSFGILLGIGQFIVAGYFFGQYLPTILHWAHQFGIVLLVAALLGIAALAWMWRKRMSQAFA